MEMRKQEPYPRYRAITAAIGLILVANPGLSAAKSAEMSGVSFTDVAANGGAGISYRRTPSPTEAIWDDMRKSGPFTIPESAVLKPLKSRGAPGVAILDYDGDGDLDIYVTNGPGSENSLYSSQLQESGEVTYIDVARHAGVALASEDSTGVCYGDTDNDGDQDLMVLTLGGANHLFENLGDGTFADISSSSHAGGDNRYSASCSMGDINGDGLLDIVVSNTYTDWSDSFPINVFEFAFRNEHNDLFRNVGDNRFEDISEASGLRSFQGISWAISMVDYDMDGDTDIVVAEDQGGKPSAQRGGKDMGYVRIFQNDGEGYFTDMTNSVGTNRAGAWMGLAFADFDADGGLDIFASNIGDYTARALAPIAGFPVLPGDWLSGWFLSNGGGTFNFPGVGELQATPFGWGNAAADYDNDGDTDIIYHGGMDFGGFVDATNAGVFLRNGGSADFSLDSRANSQTNHARRTVNGVAIGDLNNDGFIDVVSVSNHDWQDPLPLVPLLPPGLGFGGPFDETAYLWPTFTPIDPTDLLQGFTWNGWVPVDGTLSIEINDGANDNNWTKVKLTGSVGITDKGVVNRDAIGAVISFTPKGGDRVITPVLGGSSYASQHALEAVFGMGDSHKGTLDIMWPGGVKSRLYNVKASEQLVIPEVACSYTDVSMSRDDFFHCVHSELKQLRAEGVIGSKMRARLLRSALRAYAETQGHRHKHHRRRRESH